MAEVMISLKAEKMIFRRALEAYRQERLDKCLRRMARERAKASKYHTLIDVVMQDHTCGSLAVL